MKQYTAENIRNIAVVGHGGSGKTTLVEALAYRTGATDRFGKVADGTTISDYDPEEVKRTSSLNLSIVPIEYSGTKINLLDAPGLFDFALGETEAIRAADTVLLVMSAKSGLTVGAEKAYREAERLHKPRAIFIGKMDSGHADFYKVLEDLIRKFGAQICPVVVPYMEDHKVKCYIDLIGMKAYTYENGSRQEVKMPDMGHRLEGLVGAISEAVAETDDELMEKYFSGEQFTMLELVQGLHKGIFDGTITPVFSGSAQEQQGLTLLLGAMVSMFPSATEVAREEGEADEGVIEVKCDPEKPTCAYVMATVADPFVGKLSYVKVISGSVTAATELCNTRTGAVERPGKLLYIRGKKQEDTDKVSAGDICAISKLSANTGDTLCDPNRKITLARPEFPKPCYSMAVKAKGKGDESKISTAIGRILEEDPTLSFYTDPETKEQILSGLGDQHLDVTVAKLKSKFGVEVILDTPTIAYRETIRKPVKVQGKHKKQSGGHGQYGDVIIEFEPCDSDGLVFEEKVVGGAVPKNFFPAVEKGLQECVQKGVLAGYPVVGLKATLLDGSYHPVDSNEMSFKMAAALAYKNGLPQASPVILEPIGSLSVIVPESVTGDVMGDLNKRRGRVLGMNAMPYGMTEVVAEVPMSEMQTYATTVRQMTQGAGSFTLEFVRYEQLPAQLEAAVIANSKNKAE
ncbi:MAG TPA: elongation factor G [Candidatus Faecivivens stercoravium]|uniref:Elongation factor G n=1 Tax=Candidatus Faecivivens stercoravium TaxID=2840803 RepID=A0A9D1DXI3_9FIRM|nr:elongation factor G [Candidatus Faecivivens stercoravium]